MNIKFKCSQHKKKQQLDQLKYLLILHIMYVHTVCTTLVPSTWKFTLPGIIQDACECFRISRQWSHLPMLQAGTHPKPMNQISEGGKHHVLYMYT